MILGMPKVVWLLLAVFAAVTAFLWWLAGDRAEHERKGAESARVRIESATIDRVQDVKTTKSEIAVEVHRGGSVRLYEQCLRSNTTAPENCGQFLPE